ncbi:ATP-binding cassette domain-containing protein [Kribbella speibonae]|uniref:ATP-binding cassette domain-containing protein n=1 Tax=Kribbella speibonae TaxID=1572660 RepID=A0A4R0J7M0_9ACTN|nr:ATP-binding cassette domain-containing protein [Kribbella speibonae]TCC42109.1 ATP-binding cassette domain-containing protein [Kribbella speibonae]
MTAVDVENLSMSYKAPIRKSGLRAAFGSLVRREYRTVQALDEVTFTIASGEVAGFIGPNGAGKTTTMKILSGILHPTGGAVRVLGTVPWQRRSAFLKRIAFVRGSQPVGGSQELTVMDSLEYQRLLYDVPRTTFRRTLAELEALLELEPLLERQLRALSLGERMRVGLAMALIYRPEVLFLDEPKLQLDVFYHSAWQLGRYPTDVFSRPLRILLTYVFPMALIASVPSTALLREPEVGVLLAGVFAAAGAASLAALAWRAGLRRYTGATS